MRPIHRSCYFLLVLLTIGSACSRQTSTSDESTQAEATVAKSAPGAERMDSAAGTASAPAQVDGDSRPTADQVASSAATYTDAQRRFIRTAQAEFGVRDVYKASLAIEDVVAAQGGFVVRNQITTQTLGSQTRPAGNGRLIELTEYTVRGDLTVRVPSDNTQAFLRAIVGQMEFLDQRNFEAIDAQFAVLRQQLAYQRNQQAQQQLGQVVEQGGKTGEKTEAIAARTDSQADRDDALIAQQEFEDRIAFSTIELSMYQPSKIRQAVLTDVEAVFQQHSPAFLARLGNSLAEGWYGILEVVIALMKLWPLWLLMLIGALIYRRFGKTR